MSSKKDKIYRIGETPSGRAVWGQEDFRNFPDSVFIAIRSADNISLDYIGVVCKSCAKEHTPQEWEEMLINDPEGITFARSMVEQEKSDFFKEEEEEWRKQHVQ